MAYQMLEQMYSLFFNSNHSSLCVVGHKDLCVVLVKKGLALKLLKAFLDATDASSGLEYASISLIRLVKQLQQQYPWKCE